MANTYYIDTSDFQTATAVYTNNTLTTLAPDGYYSREWNFRQQVNGVLQAPQTCNPQNIPSIGFGSLYCNTSSGGSTVTKAWPISISNPPDNFTVLQNTTAGSANVSLVTYNNTRYVKAIFTPSVSTSVTIRLSLRNQAGQEVAFSEVSQGSNFSSFMESCPF